MNNSMINPSIVELLEKVDNRYTLVVMASKRARQLIENDEPLIKTELKKPVTVAINEINSSAITYETLREGIK
ncbi:DNA-directed RNA polymerase subunit omega [Clostridium malenominatum]|uniref:DNA-directed RNA polymerase subunit omega n=1 Tax=Clostridium malenominatum TaxID=1539 RepID=A0ABN1IWV8_9CLOT